MVRCEVLNYVWTCNYTIHHMDIIEFTFLVDDV
jgi:hypothetical protein